MALTLQEAGLAVRAYLTAAPNGDPDTMWDRDVDRLDALMAQMADLSYAQMVEIARALGVRCSDRTGDIEVRARIFRFLRQERRWLLARRFDHWPWPGREVQAAKKRRGKDCGPGDAKRVAGAKAARSGEQ